jgi:carbon-monoxide dehydrogenase small subunit
VSRARAKRPQGAGRDGLARGTGARALASGAAGPGDGLARGAAAAAATGPRAAPPAALDRVTVRFTVNGRARRVGAPPMKRLLDVLREDLALTGTKEGCGEGECGACGVLLDGRPVNACLVPAVQCDGARVVTVEGLARGDRLSGLQRAFVEHGAAQCGICTPGMVVSAAWLLGRARGRVPSEGEVREALAGNLCRCTGYQKIVDAVRAAARAASGRPPRAGRRAESRAASARGGAPRGGAARGPGGRRAARGAKGRR